MYVTKVIDTKISSGPEAIKEQTSQLQAVAARVGEAERRIADMEAAATSSEVKLTRLKKQVQDMWEHVDDLDMMTHSQHTRRLGYSEILQDVDP